MKRSRARPIASALRGARARIAWCMVGTAVYQVGSAASSQAKKRSASKPGAHQTEPPAARLDGDRGDEAVDVEERHDVQAAVARASAPAPRRCAAAEAAMFDCEQRHDLRARGGAGGVQDRARCRRARPAPASGASAGARSAAGVKLPAGAPGRRRAAAPARPWRGRGLERRAVVAGVGTTSALARRSREVEVELLAPVGRVQRRGGRGRRRWRRRRRPSPGRSAARSRRGRRGRCRLRAGRRAVRSASCAQPAVAEPGPVRRADGGRVRRVAGEQRREGGGHGLRRPGR